MARNPQKFKRYWPIILLAATLAEHAHAPLISGVRADGGNINYATPGAAVSHPRPSGKTPSRSDIHGPSSPSPVDPQKVAEKLKQLEPQKPLDPLADLLAGIAIGNFGSDPGHSDFPDLLSTTALPLSDAGSSAGGATDTADLGIDPRYAVPVDSQTVVYDGFDFTAHPSRQPADVLPQHQATAAAQIAVPEPAALPMLLMTVLLAAPRRRRPA